MKFFKGVCIFHLKYQLNNQPDAISLKGVGSSCTIMFQGRLNLSMRKHGRIKGKKYWLHRWNIQSLNSARVKISKTISFCEIYAGNLLVTAAFGSADSVLNKSFGRVKLESTSAKVALRFPEENVFPSLMFLKVVKSDKFRRLFLPTKILDYYELNEENSFSK